MKMVNNCVEAIKFAASGPGIELGLTVAGFSEVLRRVEPPLQDMVNRVVPPRLTAFLVQALNAALSWGVQSQTPVIGGAQGGSFSGDGHGAFSGPLG